jgi:hypothetical protein
MISWSTPELFASASERVDPVTGMRDSPDTPGLFTVASQSKLAGTFAFKTAFTTDPLQIGGTVVGCMKTAGTTWTVAMPRGPTQPKSEVAVPVYVTHCGIAERLSKTSSMMFPDWIVADSPATEACGAADQAKEEPV